MPNDPRGGVVRNLFDLRHVENQITAEVNDLIRELFDDLSSKIAANAPTDLADMTVRQRRTAAMMDELEGVIGGKMEEIREKLAGDFTGVGLHQAGWAEQHLSDVVSGLGVDIASANMGRDMLESIIQNDPFQGATLSTWAEKLGDDTTFRVRRQVQLGMAQNEDIGAMVRRVRGTRTASGRFAGGVMDTTSRDAEALVRTGVNHISNRAHKETFKANSDVTETYTYTATLDTRTSDICMGLDGQTFPYDEGPEPPQHINCRSVMTPNVKWEELGVDPPPEGTRASMGGQVKSSTTYQDWLKNQSTEVQNEILGPARGKLFREGKMGLTDLVRSDGRRRTLEDLAGGTRLPPTGIIDDAEAMSAAQRAFTKMNSTDGLEYGMRLAEEMQVPKEGMGVRDFEIMWDVVEGNKTSPRATHGWNGVVRLRKDIKRDLDDFVFAMEQGEEITPSQWRAFQTTVHEIRHGQSGLTKIDVKFAKQDYRAKAGRFMEEGLVEFKARNTTRHLMNEFLDEPDMIGIGQMRNAVPGSYSKEIRFFDWVRRTNGVEKVDEIFNAAGNRERAKLIGDALREDVKKTLRFRLGRHFDNMSDETIERLMGTIDDADPNRLGKALISHWDGLRMDMNTGSKFKRFFSRIGADISGVEF